MSLKDLIYHFFHVNYIRVIPRSWVIMDGLLTDMEATVGTYELRSYSGEQCDRQGVPKNMRSIVLLGVSI